VTQPRAERADDEDKARITIVMATDMLERVKAVARKKATPPSILIRQWIAERLDQEG
jgi:hypothetical protein